MNFLFSFLFWAANTPIPHHIFISKSKNTNITLICKNHISSNYYKFPFHYLVVAWHSNRTQHQVTNQVRRPFFFCSFLDTTENTNENHNIYHTFAYHFPLHSFFFSCSFSTQHQVTQPCFVISKTLLMLPKVTTQHQHPHHLSSLRVILTQTTLT